jgi:hypothetical protein
VGAHALWIATSAKPEEIAQRLDKSAGVRAVAVLTGGAYSRAERQAAGALAVYEDCAEMVAKRFPSGV